jgi:hypothetical protein
MRMHMRGTRALRSMIDHPKLLTCNHTSTYLERLNKGQCPHIPDSIAAQIQMAQRTRRQSHRLCQRHGTRISHPISGEIERHTRTIACQGCRQSGGSSVCYPVACYTERMYCWVNLHQPCQGLCHPVVGAHVVPDESRDGGVMRKCYGQGH